MKLSDEARNVLNAEASRQLLEEVRARIECSWHTKTFGHALVIHEGSPNAKTSHTVCSACYTIASPIKDEVELLPEHVAMVAEIAKARKPIEEQLILHKPQQLASPYTTTTNRRGGTTQTVSSRKETPWSYEGIDIV
jgi:hypothetical protein